jgi:Phage protein Gp19/Gp15/Gp42
VAEVYATVDDVRGAWERAIPDPRVPYVQGRLHAAHRLLRSPRNAPGLDARVEAGLIDRDLVKDVIVEMVLRVLRNPSGFRSETDGDYSYSRDTQVASGRLVVNEDELESLGYGSASTYSTAGTDTDLACAWGRDPHPRRRHR